MAERFRLALLCWLLPAALGAQVRAVASFDRAQVEAGDTAVLRVQVAGVQAAPQRVSLGAWLPTVPADHLRTRSAWRRTGEYWVQTISLLLLDTGRLTLPPVLVHLQVGEPVPTNPVEIAVVAPAVPADIGAMAPLRDIRRHPAAWYDDYWPAALPVLAAGLLALWWWRRRRRARPVPSPAPAPEMPRPSARDLALQQLDALAQQKPWTSPEGVLEYYAALSWIVREFLQAQYGFPALEMTTAEIAQTLKRTAAPWADEAQRLLQQADWVKFANAHPKSRAHEHWLDVARRLCSY